MKLRFQPFEEQLNLPAQPVYLHQLTRVSLFCRQSRQQPDDLSQAGPGGYGAGWNPRHGTAQRPAFVALRRVFWGYRNMYIELYSPYLRHFALFFEQRYTIAPGVAEPDRVRV